MEARSFANLPYNHPFNIVASFYRCCILSCCENKVNDSVEASKLLREENLLDLAFYTDVIEGFLELKQTHERLNAYDPHRPGPPRTSNLRFQVFGLVIPHYDQN